MIAANGYEGIKAGPNLSESVSLFSRKMNKLCIDDFKYHKYERCCTFDGSEVYTIECYFIKKKKKMN